MATAGLQVVNTQNILQIDGLYRNLYFSGKITRTLVGGNFETVSLDATNNIYVVRTESGYNHWFTVTQVASNVMYFIGSAGCVVDIYVFTFSVPPAGNFGLNAFDESGSLVYSSNSKAMLILDAFNYSGLNFSYANTFSGSKPGVVIAAATYFYSMENYDPGRPDTYVESAQGTRWRFSGDYIEASTIGDALFARSVTGPSYSNKFYSAQGDNGLIVKLVNI